MSNDRTHWLGFDLGGTKMLAVVYDAKFKPMGRARQKTKGREGVETGARRIIDTARQAIEKAGISAKDLGGIGMGCPGPLDLDRGMLLDAPNLGWRNFPVKDVLEEEFGCRAVIANDVDAGVYGEYRFGAGRDGRCVLGVFPGTGIGGGCVYEGRIFRGQTGSCLEIGHVQVIPEGPRCGCGRRGCLEAVASRLAISAEAAKAAFRGQAPHLLTAAGTDLANIRSGALADAIEAGDTAIKEIVLHAAQQIGIVVAGVINLLAPDIVVLGGGLVEAMPELFHTAISKAAGRRVMPSFASTFRVVAAELGGDAAVMGAAAWAQHSIRTPG